MPYLPLLTKPAPPVTPPHVTPPEPTLTISEASAESGVPAHVLRYWETEFPALAPGKNSQGHRAYAPADLATVERIRYLLREEKYTIEGARQRLDYEIGGGDSVSPREDLLAVRDFLVSLRERVG